MPPRKLLRRSLHQRAESSPPAPQLVEVSPTLSSLVTRRRDSLPSNTIRRVFTYCGRRFISALGWTERRKRRSFLADHIRRSGRKRRGLAAATVVVGKDNAHGPREIHSTNRPADDSFSDFEEEEDIVMTASHDYPPTVSGWSQLRALLWKSWLTQIRRPLWTLAELLVPLILTGSLMSVHFLVESERRGDTAFEPFTIYGDGRDLMTRVDGERLASPSFMPSELYYAPRTPVTEVIVRKLVNKLNLVPKWAPGNRCSQSVADVAEELQKADAWNTPLFQVTAATAFDNSSILEQVLFEKLKSYSSTFFAGIVFDDRFANAQDTKKVEYTLRFPFEQRNLLPSLMRGSTVYTWSTNQFGINDQQDVHRMPNNSDGGIPGYWREGFLTLQRALDTVLTETMEPDSLCLMATSNVQLTRFPFVAYVSHPLIEQFALIMPSVMVVSFVLSLLYIARSLTIEKETHLVEYIEVVTGLPSWVQWTSHFLVNFVKLTIIAFIMTAMLCTTLLSSSSPLLVFLFIFSFCMNVIAFAFFISAFFNGANNATLCAGVVWFLLYVPCLYAQRFYTELSRTDKMCFSLLAHGATVIGCQMIAALEAKGSGLRWENVGARLASNDLTPYEMLLFLFADSLPLFILAFYVDAVRSGRRRWYFIFPCLGWCCGESWSSGSIDQTAPPHFDSNTVEKSSSEKRASLLIENVVKKYKDHNGREVRALSNFSLYVQPGELTVILGHNGAGKTTLMKILTGCQKPTGGKIFINDKDVSSEMEMIRHTLGYCPQYNTLFDCLTVEEHLQFYLMLKNSRALVSGDKINQMLKKLRLDKKKGDMAKNLSGGQKRRLSLAMALIGGSQVILLDEPTSGMDPGAKGDIIDVVKHIKQPNVTLVLVTHYVDEAELLGDRVAIVADGRLRCYGTNMFLKNRFGNGYRVTVSFVMEPGKRIRVDAAAQRVQESIDEMCPGACRLVKTKGHEATFMLHSVPDATETCRRHQLVLLTLETLSTPLFIRSISVNMPSMQDVFMNCSSSEAKQDAKGITAVTIDDFEEQARHLDLPLTTTERNTGTLLVIQQFVASFRKRALYSWRQKRLVFFQFLVLALSVGMGAVLNYLLRRYQPQMPPLEMTPSGYGGSIVPVTMSLNSDNDSGATPEPVIRRLADNLVQTFRNSVFVDSTVEELPSHTDLTSWLLQRSRDDGEPFTRSRLFAVEIEKKLLQLNVTSIQYFNLNGYFNPRASHSLGALMNAIGNAVLKHYCEECQIRTINYPLPQTTILYYPFGDDFVTVLCVLVGMAFFCTTFAVSIVEERANGAKHLQMLMGLRLGAYWAANCVWDVILYLFASLLVLGLWRAGGSLLLKETIGFAHALLMLGGFGAAIIPMTYALTFILRTPASAMTVLTTINLIFGLTPTLTVAMLAHLSFAQPELRDVERQITDVCASLFPQFTLARSLMAYYNNIIMKQQCEAMNLCEWLSQSTNVYFRVTDNPLEWQLPGIGRLLTTMLLQSIVFFCFLFLFECFSLQPSRWWDARVSTAKHPTANTVSWSTRMDPNGIEHIGSEPGGGGRRVLLDVRDLCVRYEKEDSANPKPAAVEKLSFRVSRGEIFGFNGENGSGKTSTYKVLTGLLAPYSGEAIMNGKNVRSSWRKAASNVGYCPQFDALLERLTGSEILTHFARLRGLVGYEIPRVVSGLLETLELKRQADRLVKTYSGGNKRKISLAIALLGAPSLLLLDEPTCGVDPKSRRLIWGILKFMKVRLNAGILLTSHDMEECEALCDKMCVLVKGRLACINTPSALTEEYGCHYVLRLTVENCNDLEDVEEAVFALLPNAQLKAKPNSCQVHFTVPKSSDVTWSKLYRIVEGLVSQWPISDFAISRASLQEAFVAVARGETVPMLEQRRF